MTKEPKPRTPKIQSIKSRYIKTPCDYEGRNRARALRMELCEELVNIQELYNLSRKQEREWARFYQELVVGRSVWDVYRDMNARIAQEEAANTPLPLPYDPGETGLF